MARKLYSVYNQDFIIFCAMFFEEGENWSNTTDVLLTELWAKPKYDPETRTITNVATEQEQRKYIIELWQWIEPEERNALYAQHGIVLTPEEIEFYFTQYGIT